jgi:hypothetical protein
MMPTDILSLYSVVLVVGILGNIFGNHFHTKTKEIVEE